MKIIQLSKSYSINRDDNDLRVVACPKCSSVNIFDTKLNVELTTEGGMTPLFQCNKCKQFFSLFTEDGMPEITEKMAKQGLKDGNRDMQPDGHDEHEHGYYIPFKSKPPSISQNVYNNSRFGDDPEKADKFKSKIEKMLSSNQIIQNQALLQSIDWDTIKTYKKSKS